MHLISRCSQGRSAALAFIFGAGLQCLASFACAQDQNPAIQPRPVQAAPSDTSAASSNQITIHVAVTDKLGHHVDGLQASDFTVLDNKDPQKLIIFRASSDRTASAEPVHVFIVLDMINTDFSEVAWERQQLDEFLKQDNGKLANPTSVAFLADGGAQMQKQATLDGKALLAAFDKSQTTLRTITRGAGFYGAAERLEMSLGQLSQLAAIGASLPGRKLFLVISGGWPMLPRAGEQEDEKQGNWVFNSIVQLTNGLRESQITLFCLDPFELGRSNPFYYQGYLKGVALAKQAQYPNLALQVLAEHSGGEVLIKGKDITGDLNIAVRDANAGYDLTFAAAPGDRPNEYHALQVQVDKPDVKARTVSGYYARPQPVGLKH